jgi:hypothetical protein
MCVGGGWGLSAHSCLFNCDCIYERTITQRSCYIVHNPMLSAFDLIIIITIFFTGKNGKIPMPNGRDGCIYKERKFFVAISLFLGNIILFT